MGVRRICFLLVLLLGLGVGARAEELRFAPLPMEPREVVEAQFRPMVRDMSRALGIPVTMVYVADYGELVEQFRLGRIDLAYLGPLPYVELRATFPKAEPLVIFREASGEPVYTCALVSMLDEVPRLAGLRDRRIALTQPLSTCGFLMTDILLRRHGSSLAQNQFFYAGTHSDALMAVARGSAHLAGAKTAIVRKFLKLGLEIRDESEPLPGFVLVANGLTVSAKVQHALVQFLEQADLQLRQGRLAWGEKVGFGAVPAKDSDFDVVRRLKEEVQAIPWEGL
jgi:phosphonate transport system substrate-binding protein